MACGWPFLVPWKCAAQVNPEYLVRLCPKLVACLFPLAHRLYQTQSFTPYAPPSYHLLSFLVPYPSCLRFIEVECLAFYSGFLVKHTGLFVNVQFSSGPALYPGFEIRPSSCFVHHPSTPSTRSSWRLAS
jgi:hypothetical protein